MSRHRNLRLLSYDEYDYYDDEDEAEQFEEGVLYSAMDVHTPSPHEEGDNGRSLRECVTDVRNRLGPEGLKVDTQRIEAALSEAGGDLDIAAAMIMSTLKPICVSLPNPPSQAISNNRLPLSPEPSSPSVRSLDRQSQKEMVNQTTDNHLQNKEDAKGGGEVPPPPPAASSQTGQQFSTHTSARKKVPLNPSCDVPTTTTTSSSLPTTSVSGRSTHSSPASRGKSPIPPVSGDKSGGVVEEDSDKRERCVHELVSAFSITPSFPCPILKFVVAK